MATVQNDNLALIIRDLVALRDNIYAEFSQIADELITANVEPEPIPDAYVRVASFSRSNVDHVVRVKDGKGICSCESATFHPERCGPKGCIHFVEAKSRGWIDKRAEFVGGL